MLILCGSLLLIITLCHGSVTGPRFSVIHYAPTRDPEDVTVNFKVYSSFPGEPVEILFGKESNAGNSESLAGVDHRLVSYQRPVGRPTTMHIALDLNGDQPFGVYYAKANITKEDMETNIKMLTKHFGSKQHKRFAFYHNVLFPSTVLPTNLSSVIRASTGDRLDIGFTGLTTNKPIEWRRNGEVLFRDKSSDTGEAFLTLDPVTINDSGIYEVYELGKRNLKQHSLVNAIIRGCPSGKWGPPACTGICDNCYNGGICDASTGTCICPTGFKGTYCLEGHFLFSIYIRKIVNIHNMDFQIII
ncbi:uncharacterized protein LOC117101890 [Anneissia japonica]|uniref:uncharacterized protein LOC117101890 n=1 Tax=Anneissia japonica TaxID=1529436 RepID=UPI001425B9E5|nr:uncharacterized protein LOC117101890 [Anneissia japonica]